MITKILTFLSNEETIEKINKAAKVIGITIVVVESILAVVEGLNKAIELLKGISEEKCIEEELEDKNDTLGNP
jgi:hypothetical protein